MYSVSQSLLLNGNRIMRPRNNEKAIISHRYACSDMDRDTTDFFPDHFALAGTQSAAHFEAERSHFVTNTARTANRAGRPIECRKQAVAGRTSNPSAEGSADPSRWHWSEAERLISC